MEEKEQTRFDTLYAQHLRALKLRGYSASTIDVYARVFCFSWWKRVRTCLGVEAGQDLFGALT